jgi:hypothetical protein
LKIKPASCTYFPETENVFPDRGATYILLYKECLLFLARLSEISRRTLLAAKTREHTAHDYNFQEISGNAS